MKAIPIILLFLICNLLISQNTDLQPNVSVTGEGIVTVVPDKVTINVQVENKGKNPKMIKQENDRIINTVLDFIKSMDVNDSDVKTQYIKLNKNYDYPTKTHSYIANQSISIQLKDLSKYEALMNGLFESGINRIDGVYFSSSKEIELQSLARIKAMQNAKNKAEEYAAVLNQSIGKAIIISEFVGNSFPGPLNRKVEMAMSSDNSGGNSQTISLGEIEIKAKVNVSFLLN